MIFIALEGLNGVGKSSLAKALAVNLNGHYIASPPQNIVGLRTIMDEASLSAHFFYYMLGNILISDDMKKNVEKKIVICDRYVHSTLARHQILGLDVSSFEPGSLDLYEPDISFFIYCNEVERRKRVELRGKKNKWDLLDEDDRLRADYIEYFRSNPKFHFLDTSHETPEESLLKILSILSERKII